MNVNESIQMERNEQHSFVIINNIPKDYRSSHLRIFFSSFIESGGFILFHYRHRPEVQKSTILDNKSRQVTNCCIVKVLADRVDQFVKDYNGEHWLDEKGRTRTTRCFMKQISLLESPDVLSLGAAICKKGTISTSLPLEREEFTLQDLESLIEMHPPSFMPNGNVGTKTSHFLKQIKSCRLPPSLISKLGLQFPRNRSRKIYSNVPYEYKKRKTFGKLFGAPPTLEAESRKTPWCSRPDSNDDSEQKVDSDKEEPEEEEEEWDRVESLQEDVSGQERNKERLFEEKIELKWEKGGSGLVFYTDAQFWDEKEGDFDAKTSDDWDIDMRVYEKDGVDNDRDMRDLIRMKLEERRRSGNEKEVDRLYDFAAFEKYNKGIGRKLLEAQGWKQGQGVGRNAAGISEPIQNDGKHPFDKKGFGYRGEKLNHHPLKRRRRRSNDCEDLVYIPTIYDKPENTQLSDSALAFSKLKYKRDFHAEAS